MRASVGPGVMFGPSSEASIRQPKYDYQKCNLSMTIRSAVSGLASITWGVCATICGAGFWLMEPVVMLGKPSVGYFPKSFRERMQGIGCES